MGPASHRRSRQGGWQNGCLENRRSDGVCVVSAGDFRLGGPRPVGVSVAWRPKIDSARGLGPGQACSRLQAAQGSCDEAHAAARPQHRSRASAARVAYVAWSRAERGNRRNPAARDCCRCIGSIERNERALRRASSGRARFEPARRPIAHGDSPDLFRRGGVAMPPQAREIPGSSGSDAFVLVYALHEVT